MTFGALTIDRNGLIAGMIGGTLTTMPTAMRTKVGAMIANSTSPAEGHAARSDLVNASSETVPRILRGPVATVGDAIGGGSRAHALAHDQEPIEALYTDIGGPEVHEQAPPAPVGVDLYCAPFDMMLMTSDSGTVVRLG